MALNDALDAISSAINELQSLVQSVRDKGGVGAAVESRVEELAGQLQQVTDDLAAAVGDTSGNGGSGEQPVG